MSAASKNFGISESALGKGERPEGCPNQASRQAPHLTSGTGADQSGN